MENKKTVKVTVEVDNLKHEGKPCEKGQVLTVTEGQARIMAEMGVTKQKVNDNGGK